MVSRTFLAFITVVIVILSFALPVLSYSMSHDIVYFMEGKIDYKKQAGHLCNTGAEMKQVIEGDGWIRKYSNIYMQDSFLQVLDNNDWFTAEDAVRNLNVTTAIELCAPGKYVYGEDGAPVAVEFLYPMIDAGFEEVFTPISSQVWATSVTPEPGYSGSLHTGFDAAYGPYAGAVWFPLITDFVYLPAESNEWRLVEDVETGETNVEWGPYYVGNYFTIQQYASTPHGITRRFIDMSSPWSHAYLVEMLTVAGSSEISDVFSMRNHVPDNQLASDWYNIF